MTNQAVDIAQVLTTFSEHWSQRRLTSLNDYDIKVAKVAGRFVWHAHPDTDEFFMVLSGTLVIHMREEDGGDVELGPNQVFTVPRGVQHCPDTKDGEEVVILLVEPKGVVNTGDATAEHGDLTKDVTDV